MTSEKSVLNEQRINKLYTDQADWANFGSFQNGWGPVTTARYRRTIGGIVQVQIQNLTPGTTTNGTSIITSGNGLPAGFRPGIVIWETVRTDALASQAPSLRIDTDGHIECNGIAAGATRVDATFSFYAEN
jgi:hypothetical protein